jgi:pimeloyl-ACP methyl ester carboxylesterase
VNDTGLRRFEWNGLTLLVRRYGPEDPGEPALAPAPAILLVHGIGVSARYFERLARALAPDATVYAVDMPGFGAAPKPEPRRSLDLVTLAELIRAFIASADIAKPVLVGHSMGCQIVVEMALQDPALSDQLVLMGPVVDTAAPTAVGQALRLLRDMCVEPPKSNAIVLGDYLRCGPRWYFRELGFMLGYPLLPRLARLATPALVIRGARDPVAPADWVARVVDVVPHGERLDVPGAAHVVQFAAPREVAAAILARAGVRR